MEVEMYRKKDEFDGKDTLFFARMPDVKLRTVKDVVIL